MTRGRSCLPAIGRGTHRSVVVELLSVCAEPGSSTQCLSTSADSCGHAAGIPAASCHLCEGKGLMRRNLWRRLWLVPLCASVVALTAAVGPITSSSADTVTITACNNRTNNSVDKLLECIQTDDLWNQLKAQQAIADAHPDAGGHASRN